MSDVLLVTPPFTQLNTPYPATAYLKGFLNGIKRSASQTDLGIEVIASLFSSQGLTEMFAYAQPSVELASENARRIYSLRNEYIATIDSVISFLQGKDLTFARLISNGDFLPKASRFDHINDLDWAFGTMGIQDKAKYLATSYLEDLSDFIVECVDSHFGFSRYAERLGRSANSFDEINELLHKPLSFVDSITTHLFSEIVSRENPKVVCFSVPFPGNLIGAFRCAQWLRQNIAEIPIVMGGGFASTELRTVSDLRVFDYFDYIILDDGEKPLELLLNKLLNDDVDRANPQMDLKRTFLRIDQQIIFCDSAEDADYRQHEIACPDYSDLPLDKYISVIEVPNPMHTLWSDGRWIKLTMAHGCYWGKCTFCDGTLPYIKNFDQLTATQLADRMELLIKQTGMRGFHFVDEAAPPALMVALALELLKRKLTVTWWTNVRFEKSFTADICQLLRASGCIAVSGGLEVASDRLLKLINKGVTVDQVARVTNNFTRSGIMVHAYLMYGFPSQTVQETIDSLEMVRQLFQAGVVHSAFWHQFALTAHSPVGKNPSSFGIKPIHSEISFAHNDVPFTDKTNIDHERFGFGLKKSLFNYMHGLCFDHPLQNWFDFKVPKTTISKDYIHLCIENEDRFQQKLNSKVIWLGAKPVVNEVSKTKKGITYLNYQLLVHRPQKTFQISLEKDRGEWLVGLLNKISVENDSFLTYAQVKADYENTFDDFELFWFSKPLSIMKQAGLLVV